MAKCKDCLHVELCARDERLTEFSPEQEALCQMFIDRNRYVVREKGEWKPVKYNAHCSCGKSYGTYHYECQVCHRVSYAQPYGLNFCPNCGADMRKENDNGVD